MLLLLSQLLATDAQASVARAKDVGRFMGMETVELSGYGVVTGLNRTGDSTKNLAAVQAVLNAVQVQGYTTEALISRNIALVQVSGTITRDARDGDRFDVTVSSVGDATSLEGGQLSITLLNTLVGEPVATAQGALVVGGYSALGGGDRAGKNHPTVARVANGGALQRELEGAVDFNGMSEVEFVLDEPDWTTVARLADGINGSFPEPIAEPMSSSTVLLHVPEDYLGRFAWFAAVVEAVPVELDAVARVVISERTGTVVMGSDVRIDDVAVAHGGLTIEVDNRTEAVQAAPLSFGTTAVLQNGSISVEEQPGQLEVIGGTSIGDLVSALNDMGVSPRDLITILQLIEAAGALHGELVVQ